MTSAPSAARCSSWPGEIGAVLVTELSRWGRSSDLVCTLDELHARGVSVLAQTGLSFDLATPEGKLMLTIMAGLAEFERDLIRQRVKFGLDAARAKGVKLGRQIGQRPSDKKAGKVHAHRRRHVDPRHRPHLQLSTATVQQILKREIAAGRISTSRSMTGSRST